MISVIMPLYNKEPFVKKAIASVMLQTYQYFEFIIVNDGSTDGSLEIVEAFKDSRIKIISTKNKGVSAARNLGIKNASNKYVSLLDADDWWAPTFLEEMKAAIVAFPGQKLFATGRVHVFEHKTIPYQNKLLPASDKTGKINHYQIISKHLPAINMSNAVVLKTHIEKTGYLVEGMQNHEDHEFWVRLAVRESIVFINKPLSFYRKHAVASQSDKIFRATDFSTYLASCNQVLASLTEKEQRWFQTYLNIFVLLSYLKYRSHYSKNETEILEVKMNMMLTGVAFAIYSVTKVFPRINFYKVLKKLNGKRK